MPKQVNVIALKSDKAAVVISLRKDNGTENYQVVVDIKIGRGLVLEQSLVVAPNVEEFSVDFNFGTSDEFTVENLVQVLEDVIRRNVPDVRGNGIGFCVVFERENPRACWQSLNLNHYGSENNEIQKTI